MKLYQVVSSRHPTIDHHKLHQKVISFNSLFYFNVEIVTKCRLRIGWIFFFRLGNITEASNEGTSHHACICIFRHAMCQRWWKGLGVSSPSAPKVQITILCVRFLHVQHASHHKHLACTCIHVSPYYTHTHTVHMYMYSGAHCSHQTLL